MPKTLRPLLLFGFCLCLAATASAQFSKERSPWPVVVSGDTVQIPFWGGINSPKPSLVDFNDDGLVDLMLGETRGKVAFFQNTGTAAQPFWTPISERIGDVNTLTWHRFCDIDADNDLDLFCDAGNLRTAFYRNVSVGPNTMFTFETDSFSVLETGFNNTGMFADLDSDNDFDFFLGAVTGALWWYRNEGNSSTPVYVLADSLYDSVFAFPGGLKTAGSEKDPQHGFSTITFADYDGDNDQDLFWGDINNSNAYLFENFGTSSVSDLAEKTEEFLPINTFGLNHTAFADLDNDTDLDMIVGAANGNDINNLVQLRNTGAPESLYVVESWNLLENIDVGSYAIPTLGDLDADGDLDMLLGRGDGTISHFENTGSATSPSMALTSNTYKGIDVGLSAAPALVDWDSDGDLDLLLGNDLGRIEYWQNQGSPANFNPVKITGQLGGIQVDILSSPWPVDWDGDGLTDLAVGEWDFNGRANVLLYENTGTASAPVLTLVTNRILKRVLRDFTLPAVVDWDCDGKKDLLIGGRFFGVTWFKNTAASGSFPDSLTLIEQPDSLPWFDDGYRLSTNFADIDGDYDREGFVGEEDGWVNFYRKDGFSCVCTLHGDPDGDAAPTVVDVVLTVNVAFRGNIDVADTDCCPHKSRLDHNCDCIVDVVDVVLIVNAAFRNGPPPCNPCDPGNQCPE